MNLSFAQDPTLLWVLRTCERDASLNPPGHSGMQSDFIRNLGFVFQSDLWKKHGGVKMWLRVDRVQDSHSQMTGRNYRLCCKKVDILSVVSKSGLRMVSWMVCSLHLGLWERHTEDIHDPAIASKFYFNIIQKSGTSLRYWRNKAGQKILGQSDQKKDSLIASLYFATCVNFL